jgi:hypothetical protein
MEHTITLPSDELEIPAASGWAKIPWIAGIVGALVLLPTLVLQYGGDHFREFLYSYLFAFAYFLTIAVGGLFFVLLHYLTRAGWSVVVRRLAECVMGTMPLFVVLALPILFFHEQIYLWTSPAGDALLEHKSGWLGSGFFLFRMVAYLAIWTFLAWYFSKWSRNQDETGDLAITRRLQSRSALGMVLFGVSLNFAAFDLLMSLDPHWFSTIFGVYVFAGSVLAILSTLILLSFQLRASGYLKNVVTWEHYHDLGKLLFAFTVFWAYIGFSQFMLIWYGNIPEETTFFHHRWGDGPAGWQGVSVFLAAGHFGLPFLFLLSSDVKRRRWSLSLAAVWLLFMHLVDVYWLVMPNLALVDESAHGFHPSLVDLACVVGVGGLFLAALAWRLRDGSLVPTKDPRLAESLAFENV